MSRDTEYLGEKSLGQRGNQAQRSVQIDEGKKDGVFLLFCYFDMRLYHEILKHSMLSIPTVNTTHQLIDSMF